MTEIITTIGQSIVDFITYLIQAITSAFNEMLWTGSGEERSLSSLAIFLFILFGIGIAVGASKLIFNLVKNR